MIPFLDRFKHHEVTGVDIGGAGIKFLRLAPSVSQWFYPGPLAARLEEEIPSVRDFVKTNGLAGSAVASNIEDSSMKIRKVELPEMPSGDLQEAVRWEMRDVVEGPLADFVVRFSRLEGVQTGDAKKIPLLAYAVRRSAVRKVTDFLRRVSLEPVLVEPAAVSLLTAFDRIEGWKKGEHYGLLDFGETKATFAAIGDGCLYFSRPLIGVSGRLLKELLEQEAGLSPQEAEDLKRRLMGGQEMGGAFDSLAERIKGLISVLLTRIAVETQRSIDAFSLMFRKERIEKIFLCGGGAMLVGLGEGLAKNLAVPTSLLDPAARFPLKARLPHLFNVALGLALYTR